MPSEYTTILTVFAVLYSRRVWQHAQILLLGAILAPGQRTVTAILRIMGLSAEKHFQNFHRVLNRAVWSSREASRLLLGMLVAAFAIRGPVVLGLDDTIERRRGAKIKAKGIYRDPVRSSHSHFVKASGLRWLSLMLLAPIPWAQRVWALPFLTVLAPSERYYQERKRAHKKLTDWARQVLLQVRRWLPGRKLVVVMDSGFAAIDFLWRVAQLANPICLIARFRLDAALYTPAPKGKPGQMGRPRKKGARLPTLEQVLNDARTCWKKVVIPDWYGEGRRMVEITSATAVWFHSGMPPLPIRWVLIRDPKGKFKSQALLSTDLSAKPEQILKWFVMRWRLEVTFHEVRDHLGVETQRQWSDWAIARSTPALLGLFSLVTLLANTHAQKGKIPIRQDAWYRKTLPTFSDALALVRQEVWQHRYFQLSQKRYDIRKMQPEVLNYLTNAAFYTP
ncbi:MAG: transposase [Candidatus Atribacteria bacterium]|nr:transposase [Candidatus Atribacteria bacterium]